MAAQTLSHSRVEWTATRPPRRVRGASVEVTEAGWSIAIGARNHHAYAVLQRAAQPVFFRDYSLGTYLSVDRNDGRMPSSTSQSIEEVAKPWFDPNFDIGEVGGDALYQVNGQITLLAHGVRNFEEELPAGHRIDGHNDWALGASEWVSHATERTVTDRSVASL